MNNNRSNIWDKYYINMKKYIDVPNVSMYEMIRRTSIKYPSYYAYTYYGNKVTYKSFISKIDRISKSFSVLGVNKGDVVSIIMPNTPEALICFYALNKIGAICNMIHPLSSESEIKYDINLTESKYIICADMVYNKIENIKKDIIFNKIIYLPVCESMDMISKIGYKLTEGKNLKEPNCEDVISYSDFAKLSYKCLKKIKDTLKGEDAAVILHSGGTTGKPKGIVLSNNNFNSMVLSGIEINKDLKAGRTILGIMPIFHGFGLGVLFHSAYVVGACTIILPSVSPKTFDKTILKYKPNIIACVPTLLESLTSSRKLHESDLSFLDCVACGGDYLNAELNNKLNKFLSDHGCLSKVRTAFGMTECTACVTMMPKEEYREGSIGIPMPNTLIKICEVGTTKEVEYGYEGEICISGPSVMMGYLKEDEESKNVLKKHSDKRIWLHSGDMGYMDKDGFVYYKTRIKRMIVSSGYNIYPSQIENIICAHPYVKTCAVVGVPHPYKKEVAKAYIVLKDNIVLNSEVKKSIREYCEKNIAAYALPYAYGYRKELPKTLIGKVAYRELVSDNDEEV